MSFEIGTPNGSSAPTPEAGLYRGLPAAMLWATLAVIWASTLLSVAFLAVIGLGLLPFSRAAGFPRLVFLGLAPAELVFMGIATAVTVRPVLRWARQVEWDRQFLTIHWYRGPATTLTWGDLQAATTTTRGETTTTTVMAASGAPFVLRAGAAGYTDLLQALRAHGLTVEG